MQSQYTQWAFWCATLAEGCLGNNLPVGGTGPQETVILYAFQVFHDKLLLLLLFISLLLFYFDFLNSIVVTTILISSFITLITRILI